MNPEQKQLLRDALVAALATMGDLGCNLATLRGTARAAGFVINDNETMLHLSYIKGKGLAEQSTASLSAAACRWKITAAGTDYAEANLLIP